MSQFHRLTITLTDDHNRAVQDALASGQYGSTSEVIREALREWKLKRALQLQEFASLKADIEVGLADMAAGRLVEFNREKIIERGRKLLAARPLID